MSTGTDFASDCIRLLESVCRTFGRRRAVLRDVENVDPPFGPETSGRATKIVHWHQ